MPKSLHNSFWHTILIYIDNVLYYQNKFDILVNRLVQMDFVDEDVHRIKECPILCTHQ